MYMETCMWKYIYVIYIICVYFLHLSGLCSFVSCLNRNEQVWFTTHSEEEKVFYTKGSKIYFKLILEVSRD